MNRICTLIFLTVIFCGLSFSQTTTPIIKDDFNRAATGDITGSKKWVRPSNVPFPDSIAIATDSSAYFHGGHYNELAWDTLYQSRLRTGVIIKQRVLPSAGSQDFSMSMYFVNSKDYNNCTGYAVFITDPNYGSKWSQFDVYTVNGNAFTGTLLATGFDTLAVGDTLIFSIDNFSQTLAFEIWHGSNYTYVNKHFKLSIQNFTYDLFLTPFYIWLRGTDYQTFWGTAQPYKFDNFMIGADAKLNIPTLAPNPVITSFTYIPGGGVDSLTPFRWQISANDTFGISKVVIVQNGIRNDSIVYSPRRRVVRWTSNATTVTKSGQGYNGYALVYNDSGKVTQSVTKSFTTKTVSSPWVVSYYPWWFENIYTYANLPWAYMTHLVDFDAFYRGYWDGVSANVRNDTVPYFYWGYRNDPSFPNHKPFRDSMVARAHLNNVKILAGFGFYHQWELFAQSDSILRVWAHHMSDTLKKYGYDGFAFDFEPQPDDAVNDQWFRAIGILRDTLDAWTTKGIIFAAPMSYPVNPGQHYSYPDNIELCDRIAPQEYDHGGFWSFGTTYNSPLYPPNTSTAPWINYDGGSDSSGLANWFPVLHYRSRVLFGMPLYGRTFHGTSQPNSQPNTLYNFVTYDSVVNYQLGAVGSVRVFDTRTQVPYITNPVKSYWTTYEDTISLYSKVDYAGKLGLGGVMTFDLGDGALLTVPPGHRQNELQEAVFRRTALAFLPDTIWTSHYKFPYMNAHIVFVTGPKNKADTSQHTYNGLIARLDSVIWAIQQTASIPVSNIAKQYLNGFNQLVNLNTDSSFEGVNNLFFTNARARLSVSGLQPITYNSTTGVFTIDTTTVGTGATTLYQNTLNAKKATTITVSGNAPLSFNNGAQDLSVNRAWIGTIDTTTNGTGLATLYQLGLKGNKNVTLTFTGTLPVNITGGTQDLSANRTWTISVDTTTANVSLVSKFQVKYANGRLMPSAHGKGISNYSVDSTKMLRGDTSWVTVKHYHFSLSSTSDSVIISDSWITTANVAEATANWAYFGSGAQVNLGSITLEIENGQVIITWSNRNQPVGSQIAMTLIGRN